MIALLASGGPSRRAWAWTFFVAALIVRLHWNLVVHPLDDYIYSDMKGYESRSAQAVENPFGVWEYAAFFPFGTHVIVAATRLIFGMENWAAVGTLYAALGAATVALGYLICARVTRFPWLAPAVGTLLVFYYPLIGLGGYLLSEVPFTALLMGTTFYAVRLTQEGRPRDAWWMGVCGGAGLCARPQMAITLALFGLLWLASRRAMPKVTPMNMGRAAIPIALFAALGIGRAYYHTGRPAFMSENGSLNFAFGRCHVTRIKSQPDGEGHGHVHFRPPPFLQLNNYEKRHKDAWFKLDRVIGDTMAYKGYIGDKHKHMEFVRDCVKKTGLWGQVKYSITNTLLLWRYNIPWPDSGKKEWRSVARYWQDIHVNLIAVPGLLGLGFFFRRHRRYAIGLVALNVFAILMIAAIFFGGARHRTAYDPSLIILASETYAVVVLAIIAGLRRLVTRRHRSTHAASEDAGTFTTGTTTPRS